MNTFNMAFRFARVHIKEIRISEGLVTVQPMHHILCYQNYDLMMLLDTRCLRYSKYHKYQSKLDEKVSSIEYNTSRNF